MLSSCIVTSEWRSWKLATWTAWAAGIQGSTVVWAPTLDVQSTTFHSHIVAKVKCTRSDTVSRAAILVQKAAKWDWPGSLPHPPANPQWAAGLALWFPTAHMLSEPCKTTCMSEALYGVSHKMLRGCCLFKATMPHGQLYALSQLCCLISAGFCLDAAMSHMMLPCCCLV